MRYFTTCCTVQVGAQCRRTLLLEEDVERSEERLAKAVSELAKQSQRADGAVSDDVTD